MIVLLTGGGTGGHITPLLAVARELKKRSPDLTLIYIGERGGKFLELVKSSDDIDVIKLIRAGKFRRYHGESWWRRAADARTNALNLRDAFYCVIGTLQAIRFLLWNRPDAIFIKGGFVGVPVGLAAALLKIPFMTHDSDTVPGLANRIVGRWARLHAVALPAEFYTYPKAKTRHVGVPLNAEFKFVDAKLRQRYRRDLGLPADAQVVLITGGSQGAKKLNQAAATAVTELLKTDKSLYVLHQAGTRANEVYKGREVPAERLRVFEFANDLYRYSGAADVIVTRAGATSIAEFAAQGRACILVPHPHLTGGHQLKNARQLENSAAALTLNETELLARPSLLSEAVEQLLNDATARQRLADNLRATAKDDAAAQIAVLIEELAA